jgi:hypothetical protein
MVRGKKMTLLFKPSLFILLALVTFYRDNMLPFFQDILCGCLRIRITEVGVGRGCESFPSFKATKLKSRVRKERVWEFYHLAEGIIR